MRRPTVKSTTTPCSMSWHREELETLRSIGVLLGISLTETVRLLIRVGAYRIQEDADPATFIALVTASGLAPADFGLTEGLHRKLAQTLPQGYTALKAARDYKPLNIKEKPG